MQLLNASIINKGILLNIHVPRRPWFIMNQVTTVTFPAINCTVLVSLTLPLTSTPSSSSLPCHYQNNPLRSFLMTTITFKSTCTAIAGLGKLFIAPSRFLSSVLTSCWCKGVFKTDVRLLHYLLLAQVTWTLGPPWPNLASRQLWASAQASTWGPTGFVGNHPPLWKLFRSAPVHLILCPLQSQTYLNQSESFFPKKN